MERGSVARPQPVEDEEVEGRVQSQQYVHHGLRHQDQVAQGTPRSETRNQEAAQGTKDSRTDTDDVRDRYGHQHAGQAHFLSSYCRSGVGCAG